MSMSAVSAYSRVGRASEVDSADPHRLIQNDPYKICY
jgi:hypothetical protein